MWLACDVAPAVSSVGCSLSIASRGSCHPWVSSSGCEAMVYSYQSGVFFCGSEMLAHSPEFGAFRQHAWIDTCVLLSRPQHNHHPNQFFTLTTTTTTKTTATTATTRNRRNRRNCSSSSNNNSGEDGQLRESLSHIHPPTPTPGGGFSVGSSGTWVKTPGMRDLRTPTEPCRSRRIPGSSLAVQKRYWSTYLLAGQGSYVTVAESSTSTSRWSPAVARHSRDPCNSTGPFTEGTRQDVEPQAVVASVGVMVEVVLAVTSAGGWAAAGSGGRCVDSVRDGVLLVPPSSPWRACCSRLGCWIFSRRTRLCPLRRVEEVWQHGMVDGLPGLRLDGRTIPSRRTRPSFPRFTRAQESCEEVPRDVSRVGTSEKNGSGWYCREEGLTTRSSTGFGSGDELIS